jgi:hypothetical protein
VGDTHMHAPARLKRLGTETDHGPEWNKVWEAVAAGKVCTHT